MINQLYVLLKLFPNQYWDDFELSKNPNITWEIINELSHQHLWNYNQLSANVNITWEIVQNNPDRPWNYYMLSKNPNITPSIVAQNPDKPWSYEYLSLNPNFAEIALQDILQNEADFKKSKYRREFLIMNPNLGNTAADTWHNYLKLADKHDNYWGLCHNRIITWEYLKLHHDYKSYIYWISGNKNITWDIINKNPDEKWNLFQISANVNTNINIIHEKIFKLSIDGLSLNPNLDLNLVLQHPYLHWNYQWISRNPALTAGWLLNNPEILNKLDWKYVSMNKFGKHSCINKLYLMRRYFNLWQRNVIQIREYRRQYKILYDLCIHELKLKFRDRLRQT